MHDNDHKTLADHTISVRGRAWQMLEAKRQAARSRSVQLRSRKVVAAREHEAVQKAHHKARAVPPGIAGRPLQDHVSCLDAEAVQELGDKLTLRLLESLISHLDHLRPHYLKDRIERGADDNTVTPAEAADILNLNLDAVASFIGERKLQLTDTGVRHADVVSLAAVRRRISTAALDLAEEVGRELGIE